MSDWLCRASSAAHRSPYIIAKGGSLLEVAAHGSLPRTDDFALLTQAFRGLGALPEAGDLLRLLDILCGARAPRLSAARHSSQRCLVSIRVPPCLISRERLALHRVAPPPPPAQISAVCTPRDCAASLTKSQ